MNLFNTIFLGAIEGITEFLPISSTGHLNLTRVLLGIPKTDFFTTFQIFIQLGAILAVIFFYWKTLLQNVVIWKKVIAAFIPTAIVGLILGKFIKHFLTSNEYITVTALLVGGIILIVLELLYKEKEHHADKIENISYKNAIGVGLCQAIAVIPGVSRSAATVIGALFLGTKRKTAVEFSFLLAIPTMLAATAFDLKDANFFFTPQETIALAVGLVVSCVTAFFSIAFLLRFIKTHTFIPFGIYRIVLSILFWFFIMR